MNKFRTIKFAILFLFLSLTIPISLLAATGSWNYGDGYIYYSDIYGRLGIGTTPAPGTTLHIKNDNHTSQLLIGNANAADSIWMTARDGASNTNWNASNYITTNSYVDNSTSSWKKRLSDKSSWNINMHSNTANNGRFTIQFSEASPNIGTISNWKDMLMIKADGTVLVNKLIVKSSTGGSWWADYVFDDGYNLMSLPDLNNYIKKNGHLPNIPSASDISSDGISVGEMQRLQMEKIEELTLHLIEKDSQIESLSQRIEKLEKLLGV